MVYLMSNYERKKEKYWLLKPIDGAISSDEIHDISRKLNIHPVVTKLLYSRGYTSAKDMDSFLSMESERLCNPFEMKDMEKGVGVFISSIGYGYSGSGSSIPAYAPLIFEIELVAKPEE